MGENIKGVLTDIIKNLEYLDQSSNELLNEMDSLLQQIEERRKIMRSILPKDLNPVRED